MAMGKRKRVEQGSFWTATSELPQAPGHPFHEQLNRILDEEGFDRFVEERCARVSGDTILISGAEGRPVGRV
jgi:hypothetical protein